MRRRLVLLALLAGAACGDGPSEPRLVWDPGAGELGVFPDDSFTVDDPAARTGLRLDLTPERLPMLRDVPETFQEIFRSLSTLDGFGLTAGVIVRFDGALDPASLASGEGTASFAAPIVLAVETDDGLVPWPYELELTDEDATAILAPMRPLPPRSRALVAVTRRVRAADGRPVAPSRPMAAALEGRDPGGAAARVAPRIAALAARLADAGVLDELAGVVPFTTQSVHEDALAIAAHVAGRTIEPAGAIACEEEDLWIRCEGRLEAIDYRGAAGRIWDLGTAAAPAPDASTTYELPFTAWLPLERPGPYGGDAFPTLLYGHGLGGGRDQGARLAAFAAPRGVATIAIDALRHGEHPTATSSATLTRTLDFFGISAADSSFVPLRMREHFRQSTYDKLQVLRMIAGGLDLDGDGAADLDPDRIAYLGVSLGGIMGPELLALAPEVGAGILVVPGARVGSIVSDAPQFRILIEVMRPATATDGDVARFFPVLQTILDRGDPGPWSVDLLRGAAGPHLLAGMVLDDDTVPNSTNRALARALDLPVVPPVRQDVGLVGTTGPAPVAGNLPDGRTAGLLQLDRIVENGAEKPATHSNVGASDVGVEAWFRFLDGWLTTGTPVIVDPYQELGL